MRKWLAIIAISVAFSALQGGKIATYLLCKWQMEVVQKQQNCDCEKHLDGEQTPSSQSPVSSIKEKPAEYFVNTNLSFNHSAQNSNCSSFPEGSARLLDGYASSLFHPPSIF